ncbi:MAG: HAD family hydrolase [Candidatus Limnocylindrales bacterium]
MRVEPRLRPEAITFDFGNTLVAVSRDGLRRVVERMAVDVAARSGPFSRQEFVSVWEEERSRQFLEEVPAGREVDLEQRLVRVLARLRGAVPPPADGRWDDAVAARSSSADERNVAIDAYSAAFIAEIPAPPSIEPLLARLAATHRLALLSNWPHATTIDRYLEAAGWMRHLRAVVVSQRVGAVKPAAEIFRVAEAALEVSPRRILHVGDDWAADIVGAKRAGWLAAYLPGRQADSPLPASAPHGGVVADLELADVTDLPNHID